LDAWMQTHAKNYDSKLSQIKIDLGSKNGYNVGCVHLNKKYNDLILCDDISIVSDNDPRVYHARVTNRERVNQKSTRLYFEIDYVLSFWDTIDICTCFVERHHVVDDWDSQTDHNGSISQRYTASKYLLPEPVPVNLIE